MSCIQFFLSVTLYFTQEEEENKTVLFGMSVKWLYPHYPAGQNFSCHTERRHTKRESRKVAYFAVIRVTLSGLRGEGGGEANPVPTISTKVGSYLIILCP
jgi:hypothetical protein